MQDVAIEIMATFLIWILYTGLVVLWFIDGKIKKEQVIHAIVAGLLAWVITYIVKYIFQTDRPFEINGREADVLITPKDPAFPSSHTALAFSLAVTIYMHDRKVGRWYIIGALTVGIARILANVHYPLDIVGGAFIGTMIAVVLEKTHMFNLLSKKK